MLGGQQTTYLGRFDLWKTPWTQPLASSLVIPLNSWKFPLGGVRKAHCVLPLLWPGKLMVARGLCCGEGIGLCPALLGSSSVMLGSYLDLFLWLPLCKRGMGLSFVQRWFEFNKAHDILSQQSYNSWETHLQICQPRGQTYFCSYVHVF